MAYHEIDDVGEAADALRRSYFVRWQPPEPWQPIPYPDVARLLDRFAARPRNFEGVTLAVLEGAAGAGGGAGGEAT